MLDFDAVSEDWDGTVAYTNVVRGPFGLMSAVWNNAQMTVSETAPAPSPPPSPAPEADKVYVGGDAPYPSMTVGEYTLASATYSGEPVYTKTGGGYTWSLYKRAYDRWVLDYNAIDERWSGTVAYSDVFSGAGGLTSVAWNRPGMTVSGSAPTASSHHIPAAAYLNSDERPLDLPAPPDSYLQPIQFSTSPVAAAAPPASELQPGSGSNGSGSGSDDGSSGDNGDSSATPLPPAEPLATVAEINVHVNVHSGSADSLYTPLALALSAGAGALLVVAVGVAGFAIYKCNRPAKIRGGHLEMPSKVIDDIEAAAAAGTSFDKESRKTAANI